MKRLLLLLLLSFVVGIWISFADQTLIQENGRWSRYIYETWFQDSMKFKWQWKNQEKILKWQFSWELISGMNFESWFLSWKQILSWNEYKSIFSWDDEFMKKRFKIFSWDYEASPKEFLWTGNGIKRMLPKEFFEKHPPKNINWWSDFHKEKIKNDNNFKKFKDMYLEKEKLLEKILKKVDQTIFVWKLTWYNTERLDSIRLHIIDIQDIHEQLKNDFINWEFKYWRNVWKELNDSIKDIMEDLRIELVSMKQFLIKKKTDRK